MQSNNTGENKIIKGVILVVIVVALAFVLTNYVLNKGSNKVVPAENEQQNTSVENTEEINKRNSRPEYISTANKITTSLIDVENTEENVQAFSDLINYDFDSYKIISEDAEKYTDQFNALDTVITMTIYSDDPSLDVQKIMDETELLVQSYEKLISKTVEGSFTSDLNKNSSYDASDKVYRDLIYFLVDRSQFYAEISGGAFDVTVQPLVSLWNINNGNTEVPSQEKIDEAVSLIDYKNFTYDATTYTLTNGATVDFGAIAKGYMADILKASLMSKGIDSGLVNLGGNVITIGEKPGGKAWVIGIQDPRYDTGALIGTVNVKNKTIVTSGVYERFFEKDGVRYHHLLDPKTGYPGGKGLASTTIISDRSIDCDALSTTTFLLGIEEGLNLINSMDGFEAMYITEDIEFSYSNNFMDLYQFTPEEK